MSIVRVEAREGIALVTLDRPPANAFVPELVDELRQAFVGSSEARAVLLSSALPNLFSAGWDLPTIVRFDRGRMSRFVDSYCDLVREVFAFGAPVLAALSGHAIAGGLILAAAADERYAAEGNAKFGLSEVALGVPVPACLLEVFRYAIGARATERLAASGENCSAQGAPLRSAWPIALWRGRCFPRAPGSEFVSSPSGRPRPTPPSSGASGRRRSTVSIKPDAPIRFSTAGSGPTPRSASARWWRN
jgi:hypothetical protein